MPGKDKASCKLPPRQNNIPLPILTARPLIRSYARVSRPYGVKAVCPEIRPCARTERHPPPPGSRKGVPDKRPPTKPSLSKGTTKATARMKSHPKRLKRCSTYRPGWPSKEGEGFKKKAPQTQFPEFPDSRWKSQPA